MTCTYHVSRKQRFLSDDLKNSPIKKRNGVTAGLAPPAEAELTQVNIGRSDENLVSPNPSLLVTSKMQINDLHCDNVAFLEV